MALTVYAQNIVAKKLQVCQDKAAHKKITFGIEVSTCILKRIGVKI